MSVEKFLIINDLNFDLRQQLTNNYKFNSLDVEDVFTNTQLPKFELRETYIYIFLHFPEFDQQDKVYYNKELHCFLNSDQLLVINKNKMKNLKNFLSTKDLQNLDTPFRIFYEMLDYLVTLSFKDIIKFKQEIFSIEREIFKFENTQDNLKEILVLKRNLVYFTSTIHSLQIVIEDIQNKYGKTIGTEGLEKLDDSLDKIKKIFSSLNNYREHLKLLTETNETLINRYTNDILKILTSFSILSLIPSTIAAFFGMNVYFGWNNDSLWPLVGITLLTIMVTSFCYFFFRRKGWL